MRYLVLSALALLGLAAPASACPHVSPAAQALGLTTCSACAANYAAPAAQLQVQTYAPAPVAAPVQQQTTTVTQQPVQTQTYTTTHTVTAQPVQQVTTVVPQLQVQAYSYAPVQPVVAVQRVVVPHYSAPLLQLNVGHGHGFRGLRSGALIGGNGLGFLQGY